MAAPVKLTRWMRWRRSIACALIVALLLAFGLPALVASSALVALAVSSVDVVAATIVIVDTLAAIAVALGAQGAASSCARRLARRPGLVARGSGAWLQAVLGTVFLAAIVSPVAAMDSPATTVYVAGSLAMAAGVAAGVASGAAAAAISARKRASAYKAKRALPTRTGYTIQRPPQTRTTRPTHRRRHRTATTARHPYGQGQHPPPHFGDISDTKETSCRRLEPAHIASDCAVGPTEARQQAPATKAR